MPDGIGSVSVSVVPDAEGFWREFVRRTDPGAGSAGREVGRDVRRGMDESLARPVDVKVKADTKQATQQTNLLRDAILFLGPAAVPVGGVLAGAFLGAIPAAATLALGVAGIRDEMKSGQLVGTQYGKDLASLGSEADKLKSIAAGGLLSGIDRALQTSGPLFATVNADVSVMATQLGNIVAGAGPALVSIFTALNPLFVTFGDLLTTGAQHLEHWATSTTGIQSFVTYAQAELPQVAHVLGELVVLVSHLAQGLAPLGGAVLSALNLFVGALDSIPVGVLRTALPLALSLYAAFRAYGLLTPIIGGLNRAVESLAPTFRTGAAASATATSAQLADQLRLEAGYAQMTAAILTANADLAASAAATAEAMTATSAGTLSLFAGESAAVAGAEVEMAASFEGMNSLFASHEQVVATATAAAAASMQAEADVAVAASVEISAAATAAADAVATEGAVASAGWASMLGPIGALVIGVGILGTALLGGSDDAQKAAAAQNSYAESVKKSTDALSLANRQQTIDNLAKDGALTQFDKLTKANAGLGLTYNDLTLAVNGSKEQFDKVETTLKNLETAGTRSVTTGRNVTAGISGQAKAASGLAETIRTLRDGLSAEIKLQLALEAAQRQAQIATDGGTEAVTRQAQQYHTTADAYLAAQKAAQANIDKSKEQTLQWQLENDAGSILAGTLDKLSGKSISYAQAANQFQSQLNTSVPQTGGTVDTSTAQGRLTAATEAATLAQTKYNEALAKGKPDAIAAAHLRLVRAQNAVTTATKGLTDAQVKNAKAAANNSTSLTGMSQAAVTNRGNLISLVQSAEQAAEAYGNVHKSTGAARDKLIQLRQAIIDNAVAHGEDRAAVTKYIDSILKIPAKIPPTKFQLDTAEAKRKAKELADYINGMKLAIQVSTVTGTKMLDPRLAGLATGGPVTGSGPKGVDSVARLLAPGEFVMTDKAVDKFGVGFFSALNAGIEPPRPRISIGGGGGRGGSARSVVVNQTFNGSTMPLRPEHVGPGAIRRAASDFARSS